MCGAITCTVITYIYYKKAIKKIFVVKRCVQAERETNERKKAKRIVIRGSFNVAEG